MVPALAWPRLRIVRCIMLVSLLVRCACVRISILDNDVDDGRDHTDDQHSEAEYV